MEKNRGQIILNKEEEEIKEKTGIKIRVESKRLLFYGMVAIFIYFLLSYSYKLILAYEDFYYLINSYSQHRGEPGENNILVITPTSGKTVTMPLKIEGKARTFGNILVIQVRDHTTGEVFYKEKIEISLPEGKQFGDFSIFIERLSPSPSTPRNIVLEFYLESNKGLKSNLVTTPLQLR